ncbi:MAG TPA: RidA family protein [bacterium]|jgi:enamine deaminase RidA (YjgF/YER057c/UK114 family)
MEVKKRKDRIIVTSAGKWQSVVGYSRAVRKGQFISVSGTIGINEDGTLPLGVEAQTRRAFHIIHQAILALGGELTDVVRTRMFVTDISEWETIGQIHAEFFGEILPASSMIEVSKFALDDAVVEIEADAFIED